RYVRVGEVREGGSGVRDAAESAATVGVAEPRVNADGEVQSGSLLIKREEVRITGRAAVLVALLHDAARAVVFRPAQLFERGVHVWEWGSGEPAQTAVALLRCLADPVVVRAAQRDFELGDLGDRTREEGRPIEHLDVDAALVHVAESLVDVRQRAGAFRRAL